MAADSRTSLRAPRWAIIAWGGACTVPMAAWLLGSATLAALDATADGRDTVTFVVRGTPSEAPLAVLVTGLVVAWTVLAVSFSRSIARAVHLDGDTLTVDHVLGHTPRPVTDVVALRARNDLLDLVEVAFSDGRHVVVPGGTSDRGRRRALEELGERIERRNPSCRIDL